MAGKSEGSKGNVEHHVKEEENELFDKADNVLCVKGWLAVLPGFGNSRDLLDMSGGSWCRRGDSNPHELPHTPLKRARLPVPPLRH